jgi:putative addiction module component (TIGR02574 family)
MTSAASQLLPALQALAIKDRAELATILLESLEEKDEEACQEAWDTELAARKDEILSGAVQGIPVDEAFAMLSRKHA